MKKPTKHIDQNEKKSSPNEDKVFEMQEKTSEELVNKLSAHEAFVNNAIKILYEELLNLGVDCDIQKETCDEHGNQLYCISEKNSLQQGGDGKIFLMMFKNYTFAVQFNFSTSCYRAKRLDTIGLMKEMPTFKSFFIEKIIPSKSICKKNANIGNNVEDFLEYCTRENK